MKLWFSFPFSNLPYSRGGLKIKESEPEEMLDEETGSSNFLLYSVNAFEICSITPSMWALMLESLRLILGAETWHFCKSLDVKFSTSPKSSFFAYSARLRSCLILATSFCKVCSLSVSWFFCCLIWLKCWYLA